MENIWASKGRFLVLGISIVIVFFVVLGGLCRWQIIRSAELKKEADSLRRFEIKQEANRGLILDSRGMILATTMPFWEIGVDPQRLCEEDIEKADEIAKALDIPLSVVKEAFSKKEKIGKRKIQWVCLKKNVENRDPVREEIKKILPKKIKGDNGKIRTRQYLPVYASRKYLRTYPQGQFAAHIIGFINKDGAAISGIELSMDDWLRGQDGWIEAKRDGRKREVADFRLEDAAARHGDNVQLTIDSPIQVAAEKICDSISEKYKAKGIAIIVSEVKTGRILALANYPTFNLNNIVGEQKNLALYEYYDPGSVFKIVPVAVGLESGVVSPESIFDCGVSQYPYRGRMISLPAEAHSMGKLTVRDIIKKSSNRGVAGIAIRIAETKGEDFFYKFIKKFGFTSKTNLIFDSMAEREGVVHPIKKGDVWAITRVPMGHGISVTPIQMHFAMSTIANNGKLMVPQVVDSIIDSKTNKKIVVYRPKMREQVVSATTANLVSEMLQEVVKPGGTATRAYIPKYQVAGKTGTSQKLVKGNYSNTNHVASFSGFFPASNPQVAITVVIDDAKMPGGGVAYGGLVAAPAFKEMAEFVIKWLDIKPIEEK